MRRHLPVLDETVLDRIHIDSPCPADWSRMRGDDRSRFCGQCRQHVYDLSVMTRAEAVALIADHAGSLCVQLRRRPDGRVVSSDCRERLRAARRRGLLPFVVALALVGLTQLGLHLLGLRAAWSWLSDGPGYRSQAMRGAIDLPSPIPPPVALPPEPPAPPPSDEPLPDPVPDPVIDETPKPTPPRDYSKIRGKMSIRDIHGDK